MRRRSALLALGAALTAGCVGAPAPNESQTPNDTSHNESNDSDQRDDRGWYLLAKWVEEAPPDVTPHPSDESPASNFDIVLELFDKAADEPESDTHDDPQPAVSFGESRSTEITEETKEDIEREFADIEEYKSSSSDEYYPSGRYFDHDGTIITLDIARPD